MKPNKNFYETSDRLAWLWLAIGAMLLPFALIQGVWAIAAWLMPVFLMRFSRTQRPLVGLSVIGLVQVAGAAIGIRNDFTTVPFGSLLIGIVLAYGFLFWIPFAIDRLFVPRLPTTLRTLVFPLAAVSRDYLLLFTPFYTYGSPAYTQYDNLPLVQLISVTGIWGLTFLVSWLAPTVNEIWERGTSREVLRYSVLPFSLVLAAVLVYGNARLTFTPDLPTIRVAGLTPDRNLWSYLPVAEIAQSNNNDRVALRPKIMQIVDDLLKRSEREARSGAKIIVWSETSAFILEEDEAIVIERARMLARDESVYLQLGLMVILHTDHFPYGENRAILIDPSGELIWDYHKAFPVPVGDGMEIAPGPATIPTILTPFGWLAGVICYDMDYVPYMRQAGLAHVGLVLAPADDWKAIEQDHMHISVFRAVENGFSLMRPTSKGISVAVDPLGRELAKAEYYTADQLSIVAAMPTQSLSTLYSRIGDIFAYVSILALISLATLVFLQSRSGDAFQKTVSQTV